jgi:MarR-like DNA-binding transcriptional regulator SgrR of sgrS sRNA
MAFHPEVVDLQLALHELSVLAGSPPDVVSLLRESRGEIDADRRAELVRSAHQALLQSNTLIPIASVPISFATNAKLEGVRLDRAGDPVVEDVWIAP